MDERPPIEIPWTRNRLLKAYKFMKILRVEPFLFLLMFQGSLKGSPSSLLLQDKICSNWHHQNATYCHDLPSAKESGHSPYFFKSKILADVNQFGTYSTYISTVPALLWALFVGAWIDRYVRGRKVLMLFSVGAAIMENIIILCLSINFKSSPYLMLLTHIPTSILGGHIASRIAITHYMAATTPPKLMAMRFMIMEMCMFVASPIGSSLGGYLIVQPPLFKTTGEIRNYTLCFIIASAFEVLAFLWILIMINEKVARKQEMKVEMKIRGIKGKIGKEGAKIKLRSEMSREDEARHPLRLLFDLQNVKSMVMTCIKKRPNKVRTQLFLMFGSMIVMVMAFSGGGHVSNTFIQKIYRWTPDWNAYMHSINMVVHSIATVSIVPFLLKVLKIADIPLAIIGYSTFFMANLIKGTFLTPIAAYVCMPITAIGGISSIGTRSHMTKIVGRDEIGKVMSFMSALDTLAPMVSSTIFTYIFNATIDTYPGLVYQITAALIMFPIFIMMWIDLFTKRPLVTGYKENKTEQGENGENKENEEEHKNETENVHDKNSDHHHKNHHGHQHHHHHHHRDHKRANEQDAGVENNNNIVQESDVPTTETKL